MTDRISAILKQVGSIKPPVPVDFKKLETYTVKKVSDADTLDAIDKKGNELTVRFVYIDAPETAKGWGYKKVEDLNQSNPLYQTQFHWGEAGTNRLQELVEQSQGKVKLRINDTDSRYNRVICEVYLLDGTFVQYELIREGLALIYYDYFNKCPRDTAILLLLAEAEAERQQKGLWQEPKTKFIVPWLFRAMKKAQKNLVQDPKTHDQLVKQIQKLCKKLDTGKLTDNEFAEQFKQLMK